VDPHSDGAIEYWLCISTDGVTVAGRKKNKKGIWFNTHFTFQTTGHRCITKWGAKDDVILCQLQEHENSFCAMFNSKMSVDIAYCMFRLSKSGDQDESAAA